MEIINGAIADSLIRAVNMEQEKVKKKFKSMTYCNMGKENQELSRQIVKEWIHGAGRGDCLLSKPVCPGRNLIALILKQGEEITIVRNHVVEVMLVAHMLVQCGTP